MITVQELLKDRIKYENLKDKRLKKNFDELLYKINIVRYFYDKPLRINSGYRSEKDNKRVGGSSKSHHKYCRAVDIHDKTGKFWDWCMKNEKLFVELGLYFESRNYTPTWVHIQTRPPASGKRIFNP